MAIIELTFGKIIFIVSVVVLSVLLLGVILWWIIPIIVRKTIFHKEQGHSKTLNVPHELYFIKNSRGDNIDLWWLPHPVSTEVLLYLHGSSGRLPHFFQSFCEQFNVLAPSYPGYGLSEGSPSEENVYETADLAYKWILDKGFKEDQIIIWGHSLGGSPAVYLASKHPRCKKLIVVNSFSSLKSLYKRRFSFLILPFIKNWFDTSKYAKKVEGKVVQFCYKNDKTNPFEECKLLFDSYKTTNKKLVEMEGQSHDYFDIEYTAPH